MVRTQPWAQNDDVARSSPRGSTPARPHGPKPILDSSDVEQSTPQRPARSRAGRGSEPIHQRGRSTSLAPPEEEFMLDGFDKDDRYRMVEDEFLDIAKEFTQHLHAAEYLRLKAAAKNRSSATISTISRPVTGAMPDQTKRKLESIKRAKKQVDAVAEVKKTKPKYDGESDEEAPEPWLGTALHGLMEEPKGKTASILTDVVETAASSKAAKGYRGNKEGRKDGYGLGSESDSAQAPPRSSPPNAAKQDDVETESEDDDLDAPPVVRPVARPSPRRVPTSAPPSSFRTEIKSESEPPMPPYRQQSRATTMEPPSKPIKEEDDGIELPKTSADVLARMAKRRELTRLKRLREDEEASKDQAKKRKSVDIIPTFL